MRGTLSVADAFTDLTIGMKKVHIENEPLLDNLDTRVHKVSHLSWLQWNMFCLHVCAYVRTCIGNSIVSSASPFSLFSSLYSSFFTSFPDFFLSCHLSSLSTILLPLTSILTHLSISTFSFFLSLFSVPPDHPLISPSAQLQCSSCLTVTAPCSLNSYLPLLCA